MKFASGNTVKILSGKYENLAGVVTECRSDAKSKKNKYLLHVEGVQNNEPIDVDYWCDEANGEKINGY